ncbi:MAG: nucleic acid-binding protein [Halieaceae bacterium]|jgi:uncharacterized protein|nr:nucleic acid-binding protein [Halieaceae bacterium]
MSVEYNPKYMQHFYNPVWESFEDGYWEGIKQRKLVFQKCGECETFSHPPRVMCPNCKAQNWVWVESSGKGRVYSWTVLRQEVHPAFRVPFEVVLIEMDNEEGVRIVSNMVDCNPDEIDFDMPVELCFKEVTEEWALPFFKKVE